MCVHFFKATLVVRIETLCHPLLLFSCVVLDVPGEPFNFESVQQSWLVHEYIYILYIHMYFIIFTFYYLYIIFIHIIYIYLYYIYIIIIHVCTYIYEWVTTMVAN
jgi:hypothetical protein